MHFIFKSFKQTFKQPAYLILAAATAGLILLFSIWLPNSSLLIYVFGSELFGWEAKIKILWSSLGTFHAIFTIQGQVLIILLAALSGINISLLIFYLKSKARVLKMAGVSGLGLAIGLLGVGCGACGSVILSSIFGLTAAASIVSLLPFKGVEFGLIGIILILTSIYLLAKKISQSKVC